MHKNYIIFVSVLVIGIVTALVVRTYYANRLLSNTPVDSRAEITQPPRMNRFIAVPSRTYSLSGHVKNISSDNITLDNGRTITITKDTIFTQIALANVSVQKDQTEAMKKAIASGLHPSIETSVMPEKKQKTIADVAVGMMVTVNTDSDPDHNPSAQALEVSIL